jgi:hypothetical protein
MTYTVKPSELYNKEEVNNYLGRNGLRVVDFRPSRRGEKYLGYTYDDKLFAYDHPASSDKAWYSYGGAKFEYNHVGRSPRLIVEYIIPPKPQLDFFWE